MTVILVAHILVSVVLVIVVLMQRSEGGALGIGGGGGGGGAGGGLMSGRGVTGALVRTTIIFGAIFFVTSLGLTTIATNNDRGGITEVQEELNNEFGGQAGENETGLEGLGDFRDPDIVINDDPLAVTPTPSVLDTTEEDETADPLADPQ